MANPRRPGVAITSIRWTLVAAGREFNIPKDKLSRRLKALNEAPGEDECFSTPQIARAVFGSYEAERIRATAAHADSRELEVLATRRKLIPLEAEKELLMEIGVNIRQKILALPIPAEQIDGILIEVQRLMLSHSSAKTVMKRLGIDKLVSIKTDEA